MNRINSYREAWRKARRQEELTSIKSNIRNLIYYQPTEKQDTDECALCRDDRWLITEQPRHVIRLMLAIFHEAHICNGHIEAFLSKALQCLQAEPYIYSQLMSKGEKQKRELIYRKILLQLEVFDNQLLLEDEAVWQQITLCFKKRGEFMIKLMDCAYSYDDWPVEDHDDENWDVEVKSICYASVLNIFGKFPMLFQDYLEEYPVNILIQKSRGKKRVELLSLLKAIATYAEEKIELQGTVYQLFVGFKSHLIDIKQLQLQVEIFIAELELFEAFAVGWKFMDLECISCLLCFINTNFTLYHHQTQPIVFASLELIKEKYPHLLDHASSHQIERLLTRIDEFVYENISKMQIQENSNTQMETQ